MFEEIIIRYIHPAYNIGLHDVNGEISELFMNS
jgi:hypothetical protein